MRLPARGAVRGRSPAGFGAASERVDGLADTAEANLSPGTGQNKTRPKSGMIERQ